MLGRCPACGKGPLYAGFLRIAERCSVCGADFSGADTGDGPAVFVILLVGAVVTVLALVLEMAFGVSPLMVIAAAVITTALLCATLLPMAKGLLFGLQWRYRSSQ